MNTDHGPAGCRAPRAGRHRVGPLASRVVVLAVVMGVLLAGTPGSASAADTSAPTQPGVITVSSITAVTASLKWGVSSDNVGIEGYRVYRGPATAADSALSLIATTDAVTSYIATNSAQRLRLQVRRRRHRRREQQVRDAHHDADHADLDGHHRAGRAGQYQRRPVGVLVDQDRCGVGSVLLFGRRLLRGAPGRRAWSAPSSDRIRNGSPTTAWPRPRRTATRSPRSIPPGTAPAATTAKTATTTATGTVKIAAGPLPVERHRPERGHLVVEQHPHRRVRLASTARTVTDPAGTVQHHAVTVTGPVRRHQLPVHGHQRQRVSATGTLRTAAATGQHVQFRGDRRLRRRQPRRATQNATNIGAAGTQFIQTLGDNIYPVRGAARPGFQHHSIPISMHASTSSSGQW